MRIAKLIIGQNNLGIKPINLIKRNFGPVVALVGINGSGKSRILNLLKQFPKQITLEQFKEGYVSNLPRDITLGNVGVNVEYQKFLQVYTSYLKVLNLAEFHFNSPDTNLNVTIQQLLSSSSGALASLYSAGTNEFDAINIDSITKYVQGIQLEITTAEVERYFNKAPLENNIEPTKRRLNRFNEILGVFLGQEYTFKIRFPNGSIRVEIFFNERPFNFNEFSPGQKILFRYAAMLYVYENTNQINIRDCILVIDEPETHLHPHYQIEIIKRLKELIKDNGQLWIATHSLHIISHLDYQDILMVKNGEIYPPSRKTHGELFKELIKIEDHIQEFKSYVSSISEFSYANFIIECFNDPEVITDTGINDSQYMQLKDKLTKARDKSTGVNKVKVLDFGAGLGRIGSALQEDNALQNIEYYAYDISKDNVDKIIKDKIAKEAYFDAKNIPNNTFDFVIMCNVLHEINPDEWEETFENIASVLTEDGYLLLLEHLELTRGERAHQFGYIMLSEDELNVLFNNDKLLEIKSQNDGSNNLMIKAIPKNKVKTNKDLICKALFKLQENILARLDKTRKSKSVNEIEARRYAHYAQLYINTQLYINSKGWMKGKA